VELLIVIVINLLCLLYYINKMGSSTSTADIAQLKTSVASIQSAMNGLTTKVNNFQASTVDYPTLSNQLVNTSDNLTKITNGIINSPDKLSTALTPGLIASTPFVNSINQSISKNTDFTKSVSNLITSDATFKAILKGDKGDPGNIGDLTALKSNLFTQTLQGAKHPATLWCADGDYCQVPTGSKGVDVINGSVKIGAAYLKQDDSWVRILSDPNNTGTYDKGLAARNLWTNGSLQIGDWTISQNGDGHLVFQKAGGDPGKPDTGYIRFASDGNIWANRSSGQGWVADNIGDLRNNVIRKDKQYVIKSGRGGNLTDAGGWSGDNGAWQTMKFIQN